MKKNSGSGGLSERMTIEQRTNYALGQALLDFLAVELKADGAAPHAAKIQWLVEGLQQHVAAKAPVFHWAKERLIEIELALATEGVAEQAPVKPVLQLVTPDFKPNDDIPF